MASGEENVYTALAKAQANMGPAKKGSTNPHYRSKYADLSEVMNACLPALNDVGLSVWSSMPDPNTMRTTISHGASNTHIHCDVPLIVEKNNMQGMKSATTYAKRIGVESLTGIAPEDDDGNAASSNPPKKVDNSMANYGPPFKLTDTKPADQKIADDTVLTIFKLSQAAGKDAKYMTDYFKTQFKDEKIKGVKDLSEAQGAKVILHLESLLKDAK